MTGAMGDQLLVPNREKNDNGFGAITIRKYYGK